MGIKYYYSAPTHIRQGYFIAGTNGQMLYMFDDSKFIKNLPRVTVCSILEGDKVSFGYTVCSSKDQYIKKLGQRIAYARALKKPYVVYQLENISDIHEISKRVVDEIFDKESKRIYGDVSDKS